MRKQEAAKGENGQKRRPYKLNYGLPLRSKPFSLLIFLPKRCITPKYTKGAFGLAVIWPVAEANRKEKKSVYTKR